MEINGIEICEVCMRDSKEAEGTVFIRSIKNGKESLFDHSNPNFEILLYHMIAHVKNSARTVGDEPVDIGLNAMISFVLFL